MIILLEKKTLCLTISSYKALGGGGAGGCTGYPLLPLEDFNCKLVCSFTNYNVSYFTARY